MTHRKISIRLSLMLALGIMGANQNAFAVETTPLILEEANRAKRSPRTFEEDMGHGMPSSMLGGDSPSLDGSTGQIRQMEEDYAKLMKSMHSNMNKIYNTELLDLCQDIAIDQKVLAEYLQESVRGMEQANTLLTTKKKDFERFLTRNPLENSEIILKRELLANSMTFKEEASRVKDLANRARDGLQSIEDHMAENQIILNAMNLVKQNLSPLDSFLIKFEAQRGSSYHRAREAFQNLVTSHSTLSRVMNELNTDLHHKITKGNAMIDTLGDEIHHGQPEYIEYFMEKKKNFENHRKIEIS